MTRTGARSGSYSLWRQCSSRFTIAQERREVMQPKPTFLGQQTASAFQEQSVAEAYQQRPPYPDAVFDILAGLAVDQPGRLLDAGCGTGFIARLMVALLFSALARIQHRGMASCCQSSSAIRRSSATIAMTLWLNWRAAASFRYLAGKRHAPFPSHSRSTPISSHFTGARRSRASEWTPKHRAHSMMRCARWLAATWYRTPHGR